MMQTIGRGALEFFPFCCLAVAAAWLGTRIARIRTPDPTKTYVTPINLHVQGQPIAPAGFAIVPHDMIVLRYDET